jgi:hypothetical protein
MVNVTDGARYRETSGKSWAEPPLPPPPEPPVPQSTASPTTRTASAISATAAGIRSSVLTWSERAGKGEASGGY